MSKKTKKVLVVDDSPVMQEVTEKLLTRNGFEVIACWDGEECITKAKSEKPDAILMDVILPDGDGKEFAKKIKENEQTKNIAIIFTTNTVSLEDDKGYESFKIDGTVYRAFAKPLHDQKILSVLKKEINRSKFGGLLPKGVVKDE
jgi:CheY-like chemotaxis protein